MSKPTKRFDVVAGRPYTTASGEDKKQWINCGRGTLWEDGGISIELHSVPVGAWFDGKLSLFEQKEKGAAPSRREPEASRGAFQDDEIPFVSPLTRRTWWLA